MDSQQRLSKFDIDPTARAVGMYVIAAVILLVVLRRFNVAGTVSAHV